METQTQKMALPNGTFTLTNGNGGHRTLQIRTQKEDAKFAPGKRIIALLTGPDNTSDYKPFGFVNENGISVWSKKRGKEQKFESLARMLWVMAHEEVNSYTERGCELKQSRKCIRCNRKLTDPTSIDMGIGPVCRGEM